MPERTKPEPTNVHPIASAIDQLSHRTRDIKIAAKTYMPLSSLIKVEGYKNVKSKLEEYGPLLDNEDRKTKVIARKETLKTIRMLKRLQNSNVSSVIEVGLFLSLFAAFDAFVGDLMRGLYARRPALFGSINKEICFKDVLGAESLDYLKEKVIDEDIETLKRKSYPEQFAFLENRFEIKLTRFDNWLNFVECSQRRNLLTHCDGVVSTQYQKKCKDAGMPESDIPAVGSKVSLGKKYLNRSCEMILEVGVKLGHTLWRKTLPEELELADKHLMSLLYSALEDGSWKRAQVFGEFAFLQKDKASERNNRTIIINYAQALKRSGDRDKASQLVNSIDWTASGNEFKLSELVLRECWDQAADFMREIGANDALLNEHAYHVWPLFVEFRETEHFAQAYLDLFSYPYSDRIEQELASAQVELQSESEIDTLDASEDNLVGISVGFMLSEDKHETRDLEAT